MAFDYIALRDDTVEPLLREFGDDGFLYVNDPITGAPYESQLDTDTPHDIKVLRTRFKKTDNQGTLIEVGDVLFLVSTEGLAVNPKMANRIAVNDDNDESVTYQVVRIDPLKPGPTVIFWYVHARK